MGESLGNYPEESAYLANYTRFIASLKFFGIFIDVHVKLIK